MLEFEAERGRLVATKSGVRFSAIAATAASTAGTTWRSYRRGGGPRGRILGDFLIGAHAAIQTDRLLRGDRGFYRTHYGQLAIFDPTRA